MINLQPSGSHFTWEMLVTFFCQGNEAPFYTFHIPSRKKSYKTNIFLGLHKQPTFKIAFYSKKSLIFVAIKKCAMIQTDSCLNVSSLWLKYMVWNKWFDLNPASANWLVVKPYLLTLRYLLPICLSSSS